jgi:hypothetical protein
MPSLILPQIFAAHDLLSQIQQKSVDTSEVEAMLKKADNFPVQAQAYYTGGHYIAANIYALRAMEAYQEAIESLKGLLS